MLRVGGGRDIGRDRETQGYGGKKRKKRKKEEKKKYKYLRHFI